MRRTVPVIINSFNQPTYLLRMVARLVAHDFRNIWVIDQASTTPETRQALALIESSGRCRLFTLRTNQGPHWFLSSELFDLAGTIFAYTDADLDFPNGFPPDFLTRLLSLTNKYKVGKAGCALDLSDANLFVDRVSTVRGRDYTIKQWEERFWTQPLERDVYAAIVDTTFALYNKAHFRKDEQLRAVRIAGAWTARHLPWYRDKRVSTDEWSSYEESTRHSHWFNVGRPAGPEESMTPSEPME